MVQCGFNGEPEVNKRGKSTILLNRAAVAALLGAWPGLAPNMTAQAGTVTLAWTGDKCEIRNLRDAFEVNQSKCGEGK
jgi:hypothetical protein